MFIDRSNSQVPASRKWLAGYTFIALLVVATAIDATSASAGPRSNGCPPGQVWVGGHTGCFKVPPKPQPPKPKPLKPWQNGAGVKLSPAATAAAGAR